MAEEAGAESEHAPRSKTLEDIRREIDTDFPPLVGDVRPNEADRVLEALRAPRREWKWRGYLKVAVFTTIVVEVFMLGYIAGRRYGDEDFGSALSRLTGGQGASMPAASVMSVSPRQAVEPEASPSPVALEPAPPRVDVPAHVATETAVPIDPPDLRVATPVPSPAPKAPAPMPQTPTAVRQATASVPQAPPLARRTAAPVPQTPAPGPADWVESQSQLRTALREWLLRSGYGGPNAEEDDAEVILGADGSTAKTRILVRVDRHTIIREQRWRRGPSGWGIVEERQGQSPRQP